MYKYGAKLLRVVDGDTADVMIDLGFDTWVKARLRFKGVDTWEKRTRDKEEKIKGLAATAFTQTYLELNDGKFTIQSYGKGKYGRVLAEIFIEGEEKSLNQLLIENGHAYVYDGGKKQIPSDKIKEFIKEKLMFCCRKACFCDSVSATSVRKLYSI